MASPVLALLDEPDFALKEYALNTLDAQVSEIWPEIADRLPEIEELWENPAFPAQLQAALLASKVYYNLGDLDESVRMALAAGPALDLTVRSEYVDTIVAHSLKSYVRLRQRIVDHEEDAAEVDVDPKMAQVVEQMLKHCVDAGQTTLALGIALEARRLDIVEPVLKEFPTEANMAFVLDVSVKLLATRSFRTRVLGLLEQLMSPEPERFYVLLGKVVVQLDDHRLAVRMLQGLDRALAYQVAFDLVATASQELLEKTAAEFRQSPREADARIVRILSGVPTCDYEVTFLERNNHTDGAVLQRTKLALDARNSLFHAALTFQNAFLHAGTTADGWLRANTDWLNKASHWTRFAATAGFGVIHRGNLTGGRRVLAPYLPGSRGGSAHSRAGALYGLGLVFAGFGKEVLDYLQDNLSPPGDDEDSEVLAHGACLGIALAAMRSQNLEVYGRLREVLYADSAVAGEAAGLAMGLVMLGSQHSGCEEEMLQYAHDTQHEKIIRSLALGLALLNYGKEEAADPLIDRLLGDTEPLLRYGGCFALALAYAGTGSTRATSRLLHNAVADASDDVRRAAVMALGFVLVRNPQALPRMVELLSESHNPHVRYGTTMALGVACAGTGMAAAVDVLEPMLKDPVDFVRQGAMIALAMILVQQTPDQHPRARSIRDHLAKVVQTKNEDALAKFGAALAQGIIDSGGCNTTITLEHRQTGNLNMKAVAGLAVFLQYWYWFPLAHFGSLALTPTTVASVRESDLGVPEFSLICGAPASKFGYPPKLEAAGSKAPEKLVTAILSTTAAKQRRKRRTEPDLVTQKPDKDAKEDKDKDGKDKDSKDKDSKDAKEEPEPASFELANLSRVVPWQRKYVRFAPGSRFEPVATRAEPSGVVVVRDTQPEAEINLIRTQRHTHSTEDEAEEAPLPPPFYIPASE